MDDKKDDLEKKAEDASNDVSENSENAKEIISEKAEELQEEGIELASIPWLKKEN